MLALPILSTFDKRNISTQLSEYENVLKLPLRTEFSHIQMIIPRATCSSCGLNIISAIKGGHIDHINSLNLRSVIDEMSPNPEHIDFLNNVQHNEHEQEERDDSGFCSGSFGCQIQRVSCYEDHETLLSNESELTECGFYYPETDRMAAMKLLKKSTEGTFLVRNSSDSKHLFSLSVKTKCGATSVRIKYQDGWFLFDCDERIRKRMPKFKSVLGLVDYHVKASEQGGNNSWRWEEKSGRKNMVLDITRPCRTSTPSLKHLCNVQVNKSMNQLHFQIFNHPLRNKIDEYIKGYPYVV